jgi:penicillin-binding protein 2
MQLYHPADETRGIHRRAGYLFIAFVLVFILILVRIWYLQIAQGEYYAELSQNNRIRVVTLQPRRGFIYDRSGRLLANYVPSFNLYLVMEDIPDKKLLIERLTRLVDLSSPQVQERLSVRKPAIPYLPVKIKEGLSLKEVVILESHRMELPGVRIEAEPQRHYLHGDLASHVLGYVGEITAAQLEESRNAGMLPGTVVGQFGVEKSYDRFIRGTVGRKIIEVDALGYEVTLLEEQLPQSGHDLYLTIDLSLQKVAEEIMEDEAGAIVALDPNSGEILAMVSHPAPDPNQLSRGLSSAEWRAISQDPAHSLTNRAMQGQYPPGSIFKLVVAAAALETELIDPEFEVTCRGGLRFGGRIYQDWKRQGHGVVDLHSAIVQSCDVFFYQLGRLMGIDPIAQYADLFGLGKPTGIELVSEKAGLIPSTQWKKKVRQEPWYPGENLSAAIGQGYITVTPLQMANMIGVIASSGKRYEPRLIKGLREHTTGRLYQFSSVRLKDTEVSARTFQTLREAVAGVVADKNGTGRAAYSQQVNIAGKTGTAQVIRLRPDIKNEDLSKEFQDHAWFVAFAPVEDPQIAVAVLVEHGGMGGRAAAPRAKKIIEEYFKNDRPTSAHQL